MAFRVHLTDDAARDLEELHDYIETHDAPKKADYVLGKLESVFVSLSENPHRGVYPGELTALGVRDFREVFFKPYRVIYRVIERDVYILLIADGRRDMQTLLERRLFDV